MAVVVIIWGETVIIVGRSRSCGRKRLGRIPALPLPIYVALGKNLISHAPHFCCKIKKITVSAYVLPPPLHSAVSYED